MKDYTLFGKIIDSNKNPLSGAHVIAYDEDFLKSGDFLGDSTTDSGGLFRITFDQSKFKKPWEILEGRPDVILTVQDSAGKQILKTGVMKTDKEIWYHIKVSDTRIEPNAKDIYSDNFRRILGTLNEVGANIGLENRINLNALKNMNLQQEIKDSIQNYVDGYNDRQHNFQNLMSAVSGLVNATLEEYHLGIIGYDGPQVPRQPRRTDYVQAIMWPRKETFRWE